MYYKQSNEVFYYILSSGLPVSLMNAKGGTLFWNAELKIGEC